MKVDRVLLASPRGFCAGVEMAIKSLAWMVQVFEPPVYCYHEIVHNAIVVRQFEARGVIFVDDVGEVPEGAPLMLSAHGSAPEVVAAARSRAGAVVNAVCPLVTKVHHEVKVRASKGYTVIYVGHQGHEEAIGTLAVAPTSVRLVERPEDIASLPEPEGPVAFLAQTTLAVEEWQAVLDAARARFADLWVPGRSDLCFATTNRQAALRRIAVQADAVVVIGSVNSSNTLALQRSALTAGCRTVLRVNHASELPDDLSGVVGVTAGASAPDGLVQGVLDLLDPVNGIEEITAVDEDEYFPLPRELRELVRRITDGSPLPPRVPGSDAAALMVDDRGIRASSVLASLAH